MQYLQSVTCRLPRWYRLPFAQLAGIAIPYPFPPYPFPVISAFVLPKNGHQLRRKQHPAIKSLPLCAILNAFARICRQPKEK